MLAQAAVLIPEDDVESKRAFSRWVVAFARSLRIHFQPEVSLKDECAGLLSEAELAVLLDSPHRPTRAIHAMAQVRAAHACVRMRGVGARRVRAWGWVGGVCARWSGGAGGVGERVCRGGRGCGARPDWRRATRVRRCCTTPRWTRCTPWPWALT